MNSATLLNPHHEQSKQRVDRFVHRFMPSYRLLAYYAALPLVLTPELLNYLRNQFLRGSVLDGEELPWVAEVDLLLSDLCQQVGYEQYGMDTAVRAYLLAEMEQELGTEQIQKAARLLIRYVEQLAHTHPYIPERERKSQQWAAMVYLDDHREAAAREIAEAFRDAIAPIDRLGGVDRLIDRSEMLRLSRLTNELSQELAKHPELSSGLIRYAQLVRDVLIAPNAIRPEQINQIYHPQRVLDVELPSLAQVIPGLSELIPPVRDERQRSRPVGIGVSISRADTRGRGTLTCFVRKRGQPDLMILSCNQIMANYNQGQIGDPIVQPGLYDGGNPNRDRIATLSEFIPLQREGNRADAAIAHLDPEIAVNLTELPGVGVLQGIYSGPLELGMDVAKVGCTGTTWGQISAIAIDNLEVAGGYPQGQCSFDGIIQIESRLEDEPLIQGGDSGSLIVDKQGYAIGLVFAGVAGGRQQRFIAAPIQTVLDALDLELALTLNPPALHPVLKTLEFETATLVPQGATTTPDTTLQPFEFETATLLSPLPSQWNQEELLNAVDAEVLRVYTRRLKEIERLILRHTLKNQTYEQTAMEAQQDITVLKRIGRELWQALSSTWGEKVTKTNFSAVLDRWLWQQTIQREQRQGQQWIENLGNGISLEMVAIPGGTFLMGSPENELDRDDSESPQHPVTIPSFLIGKYPVTQAQWRAVATLPQIKEELRSGPSYFNGDRQPVKRVSWHDAVEFCARLSAHTRRAYRLPSEAEWEYACRAGTTTPFHFGETIAPDLANYNGNYSYNEGPQGKYREKTTPVSQFGIANAFGLCDMHGNVWEWCLDHWHENYQGAPTDGSAWLTDNNNAGRVIRGGSWHYNPWFCRSAYRGRSNPDGRPYYLGFRVVCVLPRTP